MNEEEKSERKKSELNPFSTVVSFLYLLKASENLWLSGGIEMEHGREMGKMFLTRNKPLT